MDYIKEISINNFTCFKDESINFCDGINVFIGKNGTGKTHLLKVLFSHIHAANKFDNLSQEIQEKLLDSFFIEYIRPLKRGLNQFEIKIKAGDKIIESKSNKRDEIIAQISQNIPTINNVVYIPPSDVLTNFKTYSQFSEISKLNLDSTFYYIADALKKDKVEKPELYEISKNIDSWLNVKLSKDRNGFYQLENERKEYAPLMADGIKKLATLKYLIDNNTINKKTILFIDEPEVHLNPILISKYVDLIILLGSQGVQIFLSSHDYLFTYLLSLHSEYNKNMIKFLSHKSTNNGTNVESSKTINGLNSNSIVEEYEKLLDIEHSYFFNDKL
jgi:predicted ATP-dependent endonuclease of OLD family